MSETTRLVVLWTALLLSLAALAASVFGTGLSPSGTTAEPTVEVERSDRDYRSSKAWSAEVLDGLGERPRLDGTLSLPDFIDLLATVSAELRAEAKVAPALPIQKVWAVSAAAREGDLVVGTVSCPDGQFPISYLVMEGVGEPSIAGDGHLRTSPEVRSRLFARPGEKTGAVFTNVRLSVDGYVFVEMFCAPFSLSPLFPQVEFHSLGS